MTMMLLGIDTGGTFTDFVLAAAGRVRIHKVLSTPAAPEQAILQGIRELGLAANLDDCLVIHGSTVATNAVLEGKGVKTLYIANAGLTDVLSIGRQARQHLYHLQSAPRREPVPAACRVAVAARVDADGREITPLSNDDIQRVLDAVARERPAAVAINLLFSFYNNAHEQALCEALPAELFVSCASQVLPEYREYERGIATWLNAWTGPLMQSYLQRLQQDLGGARLSVMQSSGMTLPGAAAADRAVNLLLSGPAGGLAGARHMAARSGRRRLLSFDMGGTSTDVALIDGELRLTGEGRIGDYPVAVPMVDMHTIGAGGGSVAMVDAGGLLQVGPESAGADPGPACYGRGGRRATVTDANVVLGRLPVSAFLGGGMELSLQAARDAVADVATSLGLAIEQTAEGIVAVANEHMVKALRVMSVQRGLDPRQLTLVSFGGAGGLHVCALASALDIEEAMVPLYGGVLSAVGMLVAAPGRELSRTLAGELSALDEKAITRAFAELQQAGSRELHREGVAPSAISVHHSADLRYRGQSWTLNTPWSGRDSTREAFHLLHQQRFGHRLDMEVELVNVRVRLSGPERPLDLQGISDLQQNMPDSVEVHGCPEPVPVFSRQSLGREYRPGPLLIIDTVATTWVEAGWACCCDGAGNLLLRATNIDSKV